VSIRRKVPRIPKLVQRIETREMEGGSEPSSDKKGGTWLRSGREYGTP